MGQFGEAARIAAEMLTQGSVRDPEKAWIRAMRKVTDSTASRAKVCPKGAFLGLVDAGELRGVAGRSSMLRSDNGRYAVNALGAVRQDPTLLNDTDRLWRLATKGGKKTRNGQLDVLKGLLESGYIEID